MVRKFLRSIPLLVLAAGCLTGCIWPRNALSLQSSSVVQFLYPDQTQPLVTPTIPTLHLPLRVGVAFAPPSLPSQRNYLSGSFSEAQKTSLLRQVVADFKTLPFVQSIEIIPTTYLRPGGGFENLDQLRAIMGIDVIALVAYDQSQNTSETAWSLAYWTVVGAYFIPAQKNDTYTLMEAVVYDIPSRSLLFRAPGVSAIKGHSTLIRTDAELRGDSAQGLIEASRDLITNLQKELELFKVRAREEPQSIKIEHKPGYSGAGSNNGWFALTLGLILAVRFIRRNRSA